MSSPDRSREAHAQKRSRLSPVDVGRAASAYIAELTGKELNSVVSMARAGDGWLIEVEIVEDRRIPSSHDVLGLYRAELDADGSLLTYTRSRRYRRGDTNR